MLFAVAVAFPDTMICEGTKNSPKPPPTAETRKRAPAKRAYVWIDVVNVDSVTPECEEAVNFVPPPDPTRRDT